MKRTALTALFAVALTACDDLSNPTAVVNVGPSISLVAPIVDAPAQASTDAVAFRQQSEPWQVYIPEQLDIALFVKMVQACDITPKVTVSLSGYLPDIAKEEQHVVGFGFSMMASAKLKDCMYDLMISQGAIEI